MLKEFKEFAVKGNVIDMAVGIIIGAAFGTIVNSLVADIIMPPIGILLGKTDFSNIFLVLKEGKVPGPYETLAAARAAGATSVKVGVFTDADVVSHSAFPGPTQVKWFNGSVVQEKNCLKCL